MPAGQSRRCRTRVVAPNSIAAEQARDMAGLVEMCRKMDPAEVEALVGLGIAVGSACEALTRAVAVIKIAKNLLSRGCHVEAASVCVANSLKKLAFHAIRMGLESHSDKSEANRQVRRRLLELAAEAELLPGKL